MIGSIQRKSAEIAHACRRHGVVRLDLFGSAAGEGFDHAASDLDFVASFEQRDPPELFDRYFGLKEDLEALFGRKVDLAMEGTIGRNLRFAQSVAETRIPLYAA